MADNVIQLPNVDIFDPVMCARRWAQCATQQEINVYLNKQIDINRKVLTDTIDAQNAINAASKNKLDNHESRITDLESELAKLDKAQSDLNTAFQALQTDNNNFKSNVDLLLNQYQSTINLLQQNIDKISLSNEQLWNEVNNLKSQFDPDKLNAAIAGYDSLLRDTKAYTDAEAAKLKTQIDNVATDLQNINTTLQQMIKDSELQQQTNLQSFMNGVNADLEQQNQRITAFIQNTDNVLQSQRTWLTNEIARVDKRIDSLTAVVSQNKTDANKQFTDEQNRVNLELEAQRQEYTSFNSSQSMIIEQNRADSEKRDDDLKELINSNKTATDGDYNSLKESDTRQWDTINSILEAQNRINNKMEELNDYVDEQIKLVNAGLASAQDSIGVLQTDAQALALRAEYLEQRTGWKYKVTAKADNTGAHRYDLGFGVLNLNTTASQVQISMTLNSGVSGLISVKDTAYGMLQVIGTTAYNVINANASPNVITGFIVGYSGSASPVEFVCWYDPATAVVTFQCGYETNSDVMPKSGTAPQAAS